MYKKSLNLANVRCVPWESFIYNLCDYTILTTVYIISTSQNWLFKLHILKVN